MKIRPEKCISCGACVVICDKKAVKLIDGIARIDEILCVNCGACENKCFGRAIYKEEPDLARKKSEGASS